MRLNQNSSFRACKAMDSGESKFWPMSSGSKSLISCGWEGRQTSLTPCYSTANANVSVLILRYISFIERDCGAFLCNRKDLIAF